MALNDPEPQCSSELLHLRSDAIRRNQSPAPSRAPTRPPPRSSAEIASPRARPVSPDELQSWPGDAAPPWPRARAAPISPARDCGSSPRAPPRKIGARARLPRAPASSSSSAPATERGARGRAHSDRNQCALRAQLGRNQGAISYHQWSSVSISGRHQMPSGVIRGHQSHLLVLHRLEASFVSTERHLLHLLTLLPN